MHSHILNNKTKCCHSARLDCASFILPVDLAIILPPPSNVTRRRAQRFQYPFGVASIPSATLHCLYASCIAFHSCASPAIISGLFPTLNQPDFLCLPKQFLNFVLLWPHRSSFAGVPAGPFAVSRSLIAVDPCAFPVDAVFSPFVATSSNPVDLKTHSLQRDAPASLSSQGICTDAAPQDRHRQRTANQTRTPGTHVARTASLAPQFETCRGCTWNCLLFM